MAAKEADKLPEVEIVFLGRRVFKDKTYHFFITADRLTSLGAASIGEIEAAASPYALKKRGPNSIGGVYRGEALVADDGQLASIVTANLKFVRRSGHPDTTTWEAMDDAAMTGKAAVLAEKRRGEDQLLDKTLNDLWKLHQRLPPNARRGFRLMVNDYMQKPKP